MASIVTVTLSGHTSQLHAVYFPPIDLSDEDYVCGLVDLQTFNAIPNIDQTNNLFHYEQIETIHKKSKIAKTADTSRIDDNTEHNL